MVVQRRMYIAVLCVGRVGKVAQHKHGCDWGGGVCLFAGCAASRTVPCSKPIHNAATSSYSVIKAHIELGQDLHARVLKRYGRSTGFGTLLSAHAILNPVLLKGTEHIP